MCSTALAECIKCGDYHNFTKEYQGVCANNQPILELGIVHSIANMFTDKKQSSLKIVAHIVQNINIHEVHVLDKYWETDLSMYDLEIIDRFNFVTNPRSNLFDVLYDITCHISLWLNNDELDNVCKYPILSSDNHYLLTYLVDFYAIVNCTIINDKKNV